MVKNSIVFYFNGRDVSDLKFIRSERSKMSSAIMTVSLFLLMAGTWKIRVICYSLGPRTVNVAICFIYLGNTALNSMMSKAAKKLQLTTADFATLSKVLETADTVEQLMH